MPQAFQKRLDFAEVGALILHAPKAEQDKRHAGNAKGHCKLVEFPGLVRPAEGMEALEEVQVACREEQHDGAAEDDDEIDDRATP